MIKDKLWQEIDNLPESQLNTLLDFVQFLRYRTQQQSDFIIRQERIAGLDKGTTWVSDDFDDPLPDSFWLGDSQDNEATT